MDLERLAKVRPVDGVWPPFPLGEWRIWREAKAVLCRRLVLGEIDGAEYDRLYAEAEARWAAAWARTGGAE